MITYITTTKNRPFFLLSCAYSVACQLTIPEWIIVIDDEFDKYEKVIKLIKQWLPNTKVYCWGEIGRNKALIKAHELVQTSHVAWLDDDDLLSVNATSVLLKYLKYDLVYSDFWVIDKHNKILVSGRNKTRYNFDKMLLFNSVFHLTMYSIDLFNKCGGINPSYNSSIDYELRLRQLEFVEPIKINLPLYFYRIHNNRMSNYLKEEQRQNFIRASNEALIRRGQKGKIIENRLGKLIKINGDN